MKFTKKILKNGLVILHEKRDVPVTTVVLTSRFGAAYESEVEKGVSHVIEHMCFKGTKKRSAEQISSEIENLGGILNAFTHEEVTLYHAKLPSCNMNIALDVLFDVYFNSVFPEAEVEKEKKVICEEIKMRKDNPRIYVCDKLKQNLFGKPFGINIAGDEKSVMDLTQKYLVAKHKKFYCPANSILCIVGNNDIKDVLAFVEKFDFPESGKRESLYDVKKINLCSEEKRAGVEQANVCIGFHFPVGSSNERYAAEVFNSIFGDGMSSRLFLEVREKRGLVYAIKSELDLGTKYGYLLIYAGTDSTKVKDVISICTEEFRKMKNLSEEELAVAKKKVIGDRVVGSEGSEESAISIVLEEIMGDAKDYYTFNKKINSVSIEDMRALVSSEKYSYVILSP
jgi:predicted Zn-dependent peptidase